MLVTSESMQKLALFFRSIKLGKRAKQIEETPKVLLPRAQELRDAGVRRPTWLALIVFFFSPDFVNRASQAYLWPLSLVIPTPYLPITAVFCTYFAIYASLAVR